MDAHPDPARLEAHGRGTLPMWQVRAVVRHTRSCPDCAATVEQAHREMMDTASAGWDEAGPVRRTGKVVLGVVEVALGLVFLLALVAQLIRWLG